MSYDDSQGVSIDNYKFMAGTTSKDGMSGTWRINDFADMNGKPLLKTEWDNKSDTDRHSKTRTSYEAGAPEIVINFDQNGPENTMVVNDMEFDSVTYNVYWNTGTMEGYLSDDSGKKC